MTNSNKENKAPHSFQQDLIPLFAEALRRQLKALRASARWRIGDRLVSFAEKVLRRNDHRLALDHLDRLVDKFATFHQSNIREDSPLPAWLKREYDVRFNCPIWADKIAILVSDAKDASAVQGDIFTGQELMISLNKMEGYDARLIDAKDSLHQDDRVLISLLHDGDIRQFPNDICKVAWIRAYPEYWVQRPWFDRFDLILCSSNKIKHFIQQMIDRPCYLFPLATNWDRYQSGQYQEELACDVCFIGSKWSEKRSFEEWIKVEDAHFTFKIFGQGWADHPQFASYAQGPIDYSKLPDLYASSKIVLDCAHPTTRTWHSVNSRVFDALASGCTILTDAPMGLGELTSCTVPSFYDTSSLSEAISEHLAGQHLDDQDLRSHIRYHHTYTDRALQLTQILHHYKIEKMCIAIHIPTAEVLTLDQWGDYYMAIGLKKAFAELGVEAHLFMHGVSRDRTSGYPIHLYLRGIKPFDLVHEGLRFMWLISHPDRVELSELAQYDHCFIASKTYLRHLRHLGVTNTSLLLQCTDTDFYPPCEDTIAKSLPNLYIGHARDQGRLVPDAIADGVVKSVKVVGQGWDGRISQDRLFHHLYPYDELFHLYHAATHIVIDHHQDMRESGFVSNKVFDVLSSGVCPIVDHVDGIEEIFEDRVLYYDHVDEIDGMTSGQTQQINPHALHEWVRKQHTFHHRAAEICSRIAFLSGATPQTIGISDA